MQGFEPSLVCRLLREISRGYATLDALVKRLGLPRSRVEEILGLLLSQGFLREESVKPCDKCPFRRFCLIAKRASRLRVYRVARMPDWCT